MENFWTSNKPINGLRHFVLLNEMKEKGQIVFLMVSVLDAEINLKINHEELMNSGNWEKGWLNLPKSESIKEDYIENKSISKGERINKISIDDNSLFNIS
tara:strand:- start:47 stop:346 length:300 start_codon:yes stop_codon:yes gene_type:complete